MNPFGPSIDQVTRVAAWAGSSVNLTVLWASNGFQEVELDCRIRDVGVESVISIRP